MKKRLLILAIGIAIYVLPIWIVITFYTSQRYDIEAIIIMWAIFGLIPSIAAMIYLNNE